MNIIGRSYILITSGNKKVNDMNIIVVRKRDFTLH